MIRKYFLILTISVFIYGLLPLTFQSLYSTQFPPNTLKIRKQENDGSCAYVDAHIVKGVLVVPNYIRKKYSDVSSDEVKITGKDPFSLYNSKLAQEEIIITGSVVGVSKLCDSASFKFAPTFEVEKWSTANYYPRFQIYGKWLLYVFWASMVFSVTTLFFLILWLIQKALFRGK